MTRLLLLVACLAVALPAHAWGRLGHRLVGHLAEAELAPAARLEVDRLLGGEPEPTLAGVAAWADELRGNDPDLGRRSAPWHYVNIKAADCRFDAGTDCAGRGCIVGALDEQARVLADRAAPLEARRTALKFVVHFVGDIHQPLHANNRPDKGGNTVQIRVPGQRGEKGSNLHSWWDSGLLEQSGTDEAAHLARLRALPLAVALDAPALPVPAAAWAQASCGITQRPGFYPAGARLAPDYVPAWSPLLDAQLRRAGTQLARLLNAALVPHAKR